MRTAAILLGLLFFVVAIIYWVVPAEQLPGFFPGFEPGLNRVRLKHGIAAAVARRLAVRCRLVRRAPARGLTPARSPALSVSEMRGADPRMSLRFIRATKPAMRPWYCCIAASIS